MSATHSSECWLAWCTPEKTTSRKKSPIMYSAASTIVGAETKQQMNTFSASADETLARCLRQPEAQQYEQ